MRIQTSRTLRRGAAAVELAAVMPVLLTVIIGLWEFGRLIHAQQIVHNAARDAARVAAQATIITPTGSYVSIQTSTGPNNLVSTVQQYLQAAGITNLNGLTVTFQFLDGNTNFTDPYMGAQNQRFSVQVTIPYANVQWTTLSLFNVQTISVQCVWELLVDSPFNVNTTLPGWTPPAP